MNLDFGSVISRAWRITWNNKILWLFGILAGLGGSGGAPNFNFNMGGGGGQPGGPGNLPPDLERFFEQTDPAVIFAIVGGLVCVGLLLAIVLIALSVIGRGGLIGGIRLADQQGRVSFGEAWAIGRRHFWTLFLIGLVVGLVTLALVVVTVVPGALLTAVTFGLGALCLVPLICILSILSIILNVVAYFAQIAAVVENLGVSEALSRAWEIIKANIGAIIVLGLIVMVISGIASFLIALPLAALVVPVMFSIIGFANESAPLGTSSLLIAGLCFVLYLPVLIVLSGVIQTWVTSVWTLAYQQFTGNVPGTPRAPMAPSLAQ